ncbi:DUF1501 domain-containing protein [Wenzhouxiangella sp. EGI_FJ10409]|uniref:DUF1501 domain-containing protein n=1 Tax=Wenzhouxiangella sp. EGI_FJ10409 TaxID=3243767 RepID=UPI0035DD80B7
MRRRQFLQGCCAAALAGAVPLTTFWRPALAAGRTSNDVIVYVFLRGGIDGLHLVVPYAGPERGHYQLLRDNLAIPESRLRPLSSQWGLHPRAGGFAGDTADSAPKWLHRLWQDGQLAVVQGAGMPEHLSRSHFDAQAWIDLGTPGDKSTPDGWLTRYLAAADGLPTADIAPVFGFSDTRPMSLMGSAAALTVATPDAFRVDGFHWSWGSSDPDLAGHEGAHHRLAALWAGGGSGALLQSGRDTAEALEQMREMNFSDYQPEGGADYPGGTLGDQFRSLAQLVKEDMGIVAATVDYGGWDTHAGQGMPQPGDPNHYDYYGNRVEELSRALGAFYTDLADSSLGNLMNRVNVVVVSEFGRKVRPNDAGGTDHGHGNVMLALGGQVNGGFHGSFPGLDGSALFEGQDVATTTDYRQVLAEALVRRMGLAPSALESVFPALGSYSPLGVFAAS